MTDALTHDVLIVDPAETTLTILGPLAADDAKSLATGLTRQTAPEGTEIHVRPHSDACTHVGFERDAWRRAQADQHATQRRTRTSRPSKQAAAIEQPGLFRYDPEGKNR